MSPRILCKWAQWAGLYHLVPVLFLRKAPQITTDHHSDDRLVDHTLYGFHWFCEFCSEATEDHQGLAAAIEQFVERPDLRLIRSRIEQVLP